MYQSIVSESKNGEKHFIYPRAQDPYKSTKLPYYTQTVDNSIKFKTRIL